MTKIQVTAEEFVAEANRMLLLDSAYVAGMAFLPFAPRAVELGALGYQYDGDWNPAYQRAWDKTRQKYEIKH